MVGLLGSTIISKYDNTLKGEDSVASTTELEQFQNPGPLAQLDTPIRSKEKTDHKYSKR